MQRHIRTRAAIATAAALIAAGTITAGVSAATPEHQSGKPTKKEIAALFDGWSSALKTGDPEVVADRYADDAVLLPTLSAEIRTDRAGIVDYMEGFLAKKPEASKVQTVINVLDNNSAIDTGLYEFQLTDPATGAKSTAEARYTYEYEKRDGEWLIVNHHSSLLPDGD
ncbi:SgcJ/EcaC family oxidoreductase [Streptomyces sp. NBC_00564]|uniref:SgcJ/EcaC family oxidoreductase n=1 Tax=Streptomyces sp. NBC_00564 TaxID=2903663 RepID=UPI00352E0370|nr:SgcJ/EcaC family oxidoreductase [Streptomyces sp. NBC_00564]